jgi:CubicO group peptidase (beta-lactamase class C family)
MRFLEAFMHRYGNSAPQAALRVLVLLAASCAAWAQDVARLDQIVRAHLPNHRFMGSVLVARGPDVILSKGYGSANLEWDAPNTPRTKFRLGSVTKQFTAAAILLLQDRGKLSVDDPVRKYAPDAPAAWDKITLYHLLTHTSGIPSFTGFLEYRQWQRLETTAQETVARFRDRPLEFVPGEKWAYSNSGYLLLGYVIERVSGVSYGQFVAENLFAPLGMRDSGYDSNEAVIAQRASGYTPGPKGVVNAGYVHMSVPHAAGGLYSTTEDLLKWELGLFGGKVLSPASLEKMLTPFRRNYACGLFVETRKGRKVIEHGGSIQGFNAQLSYYPDDKLTVAVLGNVNGDAPGAIASRLAAVAHGETVILPSERKEISLDPKILARYVGLYEVSPGTNLAIAMGSDGLTAQLGAQPAGRIYAASEKRFFLRTVDAEIEFGTDPSGAVTRATLYQGGGRTVAPRIEQKAPAPTATSAQVAVKQETLARYAGTYEIAPGLDVRMTVENGRLMTQITGQPKFELFAESETSFFLKVVEAKVEFFTGAAGAVTHIVIRQGGRETKALRR